MRFPIVCCLLNLLPLTVIAFKPTFPPFQFPIPPKWHSRPQLPSIPSAPAPAPRVRPALPPPSPSSVRTVGIMAFPNVEVLDYAGPFEVFAVGGNVHNRFRVVTVSDKKTVSALNGFNVVVDHVFGDRLFPKLDVIVIPGSNLNATNEALNNPVYVNWIRSTAPTAEYILSVCTGVNFLCCAGLVDGLTLTTHHQAFDLAQQNCPNSRLVRGWRFTDNGRIFTSAGISAGIDLSLYFTKKIIGRNEVNRVVERMEYDHWKDWDYDPTRGPIERATRWTFN